MKGTNKNMLLDKTTILDSKRTFWDRTVSSSSFATEVVLCWMLCPEVFDLDTIVYSPALARMYFGNYFICCEAYFFIFLISESRYQKGLENA